MIEIILQNPDTGETEKLNDLSLTINKISKLIMKKYNYQKPPIFFTIFKEDPLNDAYLEEDDILKEINDKKLDEKTPIWWRSSEISGDLIYKLRTDRITRAGYDLEKIQKAKIFIAGIGLLGAEIALDCATLGIKNLSVLDYGMVDWFNIYRQPLYGRNDVFQPKVEVAKKRLELMGDIQITSLKTEIPSFVTLSDDVKKIRDNLKTLEEEIKKCDIIVTSLDTFSARIIIQTLALANNKILINTAAGMVGGVIQIVHDKEKDPCLGCGAFFERSQDTGACTLATFGCQKIISGFTLEIIADLLEEKPLTFNYLKYVPFKKEIETNMFSKGQNCIFCDSNDSLIKSYKENNYENLINWLIEAK
ncbi:MAG: ThiF family adenylyltransferase [Candidatus Lokiarchaeota archaeon]|nr:ThiF family adenylyltransferase [Candidatus Lokiarchaeota archaeon]